MINLSLCDKSGFWLNVYDSDCEFFSMKICYEIFYDNFLFHDVCFDESFLFKNFVSMDFLLFLTLFFFMIF